MATGAAPGWSSSGLKSRPSRGLVRSAREEIGRDVVHRQAFSASGNLERRVIGRVRREVLENVHLRTPVQVIGVRNGIGDSGPEVSEISTRRSASGYGNGRRNTAFTTLKMAVLAPIPRARARTAMTGDAASF